MYMVRNPWGISEYSKNWSHDDSRWTPEFIAQVPHGIDPTTSHQQGIFFVEHSDLAECFSFYQIGHYRDEEGYKDTWYDQELDLGFVTQHKVTPSEKRGDLYFTVETYY
mmetsp:Transcript_16497/g.28016  ORF Transcript_16497/g.28016 Transcript_16497/m.28016 type:complete len:109 (-) Transcript_16497:477-803(-)